MRDSELKEHYERMEHLSAFMLAVVLTSAVVGVLAALATHAALAMAGS